jgi:phenylacetate-CoA ligase
MVRHAGATVPFYRRRFRQAGLSEKGLRSLADYRRLPILTKADIRAGGRSLLSESFDPARLHGKQTSGSTGVPLTVYVDEASLQHKRACTLRADEWSGWRWGETVARLWGHPEDPGETWRRRVRRFLLERCTYLNTLNITEGALARFSQRLRRRPPALLFGHAHSLFLLAQYLRDRGQAGSLRPRGIIATAMVLHSWQRSTVESVFGCPVTNRYGCEEVSLIACECERHQGLHVNADGVLLEVVREGRLAEPGETGAVVVTDLTNQAMPLLRYQVGDLAVLSERSCPCGRGLPLLERLEGREADYVVTAAGELISGISLTDHLACQVPGVGQMQIVQETLKRFRFRIVRDGGFNGASERRLRALVAQRFGGEAQIECEYVAAIPQEVSGKYRFCISRVPRGPLSSSQAVLS